MRTNLALMVALTATLISGRTFAHGGGGEASNLNAAELSAHKVEKLVFLKKLDGAFQTNFRGIEVVNLPGAGDGKPSFTVVVSQEADAGKTANKVELTLDADGATLGLPKVTNGTTAAKPTAWSGKDPLTLGELALHHIEHLAAAGDKKIAQFMPALKAIRLTQSGSNAQVEVIGNGISEKLIIIEDNQGTLVSATVK